MSKIFNQNITKIFLDVDDEMTFIIESILETSSEKVLLVVPSGSEVFTNIVSLRILAKEILRLNKIVIIQTKDKEAEKLGKQVSLVVIQDSGQADTQKWQIADDLKESFTRKMDNTKRKLLSLRQIASQNAAIVESAKSEIFDIDPNEKVEISQDNLEENLISASKDEDYLENLKDPDAKVNYEENTLNSLIENQTDNESKTFEDTSSESSGNLIGTVNSDENILINTVEESLEDEVQKQPTFEELYNTYKAQKDSETTPNTVPKLRRGKLIIDENFILVTGGDVAEFDEVSGKIVQDGIEEASILQKKNPSEDIISDISNHNEINLVNHNLDSLDQETRSVNSKVKRNFLKHFSNKVKVSTKAMSMNKDLKTNVARSVSVKKKRASIFNDRVYMKGIKGAKTSPSIQSNKYLGKRLIDALFPKLKFVLQNLQKSILDFSGKVDGLFRGKKIMILMPILLFPILVLLIYSLRTAQVTIEPKPIKIEIIQDIEAKTTDQNGGLAIVPVEIEKTSSDNVTITNKVDNGSKATGFINIYNKTPNPITLPQNYKVIITAGGKTLEYEASKGGVVPNATQQITGTVYGLLAQVPITATVSGEDYNITGTTYTTGKVANYSADELVANFSNNIAGGKTNMVLIFSQKEKDELNSKLSNKLKEEIKSELTTKTKDSFILLSQEPEYTIVKEEYSTQIGAQAEEVSATLTIKGIVKGLDKGTIEAKAKEIYQVKKKELTGNGVSEYTQEITERFDYSFDNIRVNADNIIFSLHINASTLPEFSSLELKKTISGRSQSEVMTLSNDKMQIVSATMQPKFLPKFLQKLPTNFDNIEIIVKEINL